MSRSRKAAAKTKRQQRHAESRKRPQQRHAQHRAYEAATTKPMSMQPVQRFGKASRRKQRASGLKLVERALKRGRRR